MGFAGFPRETVAFLAGLREHNDRAWFDAHRAQYDAFYVGAGREFVLAAAERLQEISPGLRGEPKVLGSIGRINRDTRFSVDKRPYKDHLDIGFWEGERKRSPSGLFLRITPETCGVGLGAPPFDKPRLAAFRTAVADSEHGPALVAAVAAVEAAGHAVLGEEFKRTPAGYGELEPERERLLRFAALWSVNEQPIGDWLMGRRRWSVRSATGGR
ncbi:MAG TPA: DUF2461 domain-containing protein [Dehalococcoidia bacterium]|nr:DUF2461 domain-containing protein [Dehalococcoidia bacterium]